MAGMKGSVLVIMILLVPILCINAVACAEPAQENSLLVDYGNGRVEWYTLIPGRTLEETVTSTVTDVDVDFVNMNGIRSIGSVNGKSPVTIGTGINKQECSWRIYAWNSVEWEFLTTDVSDRYIGGSIAIGFYPKDSLKPSSNPEYREVWSSYRADSSSSGVSYSHGPETVATPVEWYVTYPGAVDGTVLYADGLIYHTSSGKYGSVGMDNLARMNCLDPVNRETLWSVTYSDSGNIEITTPVIVGDLILVTSGNWHIYCLDRFTGEPVAELAPLGEDGDMCSGSKLANYIPRKDDSSVSNDRVHLEAGISNAVYDSGALYFCTSDGLIRCFSIDRESGFREIWSHRPNSDRGCFYYYPPIVGEYAGMNFVLAGNCNGGLICVDSITGDGIWSETVYDTKGVRVGQVSSISLCSNGRAVVCYSSGEMSSSGGGVMLIDITDGSVIWQYDIRCGKTTVQGDRFYAYVSSTGSETVKDYRTGEDVELVSGYYSFWVDDCSFLWCRPTDALSIGGMTYCDGRLYSMDYSPGTEGADGGWVWCIDSDTGNVVWKVKVSPYSGGSYSMCIPTVVDGKVIVGNDYGAIYVISEISGSQFEASSDIVYKSAGLRHWSWIATIIITTAGVAIAIWLYRR